MKSRRQKACIVEKMQKQLNGLMLLTKNAHIQKGASRDSSQTSALPLEASSPSSSMDSLIYSLCANRSHSVKVGSSRSCLFP